MASTPCGQASPLSCVHLLKLMKSAPGHILWVPFFSLLLLNEIACCVLNAIQRDESRDGVASCSLLSLSFSCFGCATANLA